nr:hypothetical protein Iba_chr08bCG6900 [Ipomoea batatas]
MERVRWLRCRSNSSKSESGGQISILYRMELDHPGRSAQPFAERSTMALGKESSGTNSRKTHLLERCRCNNVTNVRL